MAYRLDSVLSWKDWVSCSSSSSSTFTNQQGVQYKVVSENGGPLSVGIMGTSNLQILDSVIPDPDKRSSHITFQPSSNESVYLAIVQSTQVSIYNTTTWEHTKIPINFQGRGYTSSVYVKGVAEDYLVAISEFDCKLCILPYNKASKTWKEPSYITSPKRPGIDWSQRLCLGGRPLLVGIKFFQLRHVIDQLPGRIVIWDLRKGKPLVTWENDEIGACPIVTRPDGRPVLVRLERGNLQQLDPDPAGSAKSLPHSSDIGRLVRNVFSLPLSDQLILIGVPAVLALVGGLVSLVAIRRVWRALPTLRKSLPSRLTV